MKNLKKTLSLLLAILMVAGMFVGCGGPGSNGTEPIITAPADPTKPYDETVKLTSFFEIAAPILSTFDPQQLQDYELLKAMKEATNIEIFTIRCALVCAHDGSLRR